MRNLLIVLVTLIAGGYAMAYEEPAYEVLESREDYEIRRYEPYVVAEIVVEADFRSAGNQAFRPLFRYISGNNTSSEKVEMTVPVVSQDADSSEKIEMTIPVVTTMPEEQTPEARSYAYYFVLPERFTVETARRRARGHRFSARYGVELAGEPEFAVYNGPFTPFFMRRNEVLVELKGP